MPMFEFNCETCGHYKREYRPKGKPPRFCSNRCHNVARAGSSYRPVKWPVTPEIHEKIKKVYQTSTGNGEVAALAQALGYPRWKLSKYAISQGWIAKQKKEPNWIKEETRILERNAHLSPKIIREKLKTKGYNRSETAIVLKRKRLKLRKNLDGESANTLSECLGVDIHAVLNAIKDGRLKATRRQTDRTLQQGGDIWYIRNRHIRQYVQDHLYEIDVRKVDKYWFVDLMLDRG